MGHIRTSRFYRYDGRRPRTVGAFSSDGLRAVLATGGALVGGGGGGLMRWVPCISTQFGKRAYQFRPSPRPQAALYSLYYSQAMGSFAMGTGHYGRAAAATKQLAAATNSRHQRPPAATMAVATGHPKTG
jgi:hypothetical protein